MPLKPTVSANDHIQGNPQATIELVEYGDYQCPYCRDFHYTVKSLQVELGDKLKFIFRNFPLDMHPNALDAAISAELMAKHQQFWPMHDLLYENQQHLDDNSLMQYAKQLGVTKKQFSADFQNTALIKKIDSDIESGLRSGVNGTPSIYINGKKYQGDYSAQALLSYIQTLI
ncbi:thioredoxin domain-containing protein [Utexia brackfieldae]|uniref:DsbA family protein n=1 Tax=Utexia brackfieldae TaxID=3074108 RepID=UPI00370D2AC1